MSQSQIGLPCFCDMNYGAGIKLTENARTIQARYYKGINNYAGENSGVAIKIIGEVNSLCHSAGHNNSPKIAIPVLTPDRINKRQNGRRFKENGEPAFTLTAQDRHGVAIGVADQVPKQGDGIYVEMPEGFFVYAIWYEKYQCYIAIRRLTPKECFRLQGWTDGYFERAAFVNSDSQLYKQSGNGITVPVVAELGKRMM